MDLRTVVLGSAAFLLAGLACSDSGGSDDDSWDPEGIYSGGEVNPEAVRMLQQNSTEPLLWLGEDFDGLRLTRAHLRSGTLHMIYGDCDAEKANPRKPSCVPPLSIRVTEAGVNPPVAALTPAPGRTAVVEERRGIQFYVDGPNMVVEFANGTTLTIFNKPGNQKELIEALRSANHEALGVEEAGPGQPLDVFTALEPET